MTLSHDVPQPVSTTGRSTAQVQLFNLMAVTLPLLGLVAAVVLLWGRGIDALHLGLLIGMYLITAIGVTVGFHRLFTHRAFATRRPVKVALAILGSMAVEGPLLRWVAQHRRHHHCSDHDGDPHSPHLHGEGFLGALQGLWHAHMGWMFKPDIPGLERYIPDLLRDPLLVRISGLFGLWVLLSALLPALIGGLLTMSWMGALLGLLWGGAVRVFLIHHVTFSINSVCHLWGTRPFHTTDHSRNNALFGVLALGEGWHNNHHAFPASARHGLRWWEMDLSWWIIRSLGALGLAWDIRTPSHQTMAAKRKDDAAFAGEPVDDHAPR